MGEMEIPAGAVNGGIGERMIVKNSFGIKVFLFFAAMLMPVFASGDEAVAPADRKTAAPVIKAAVAKPKPIVEKVEKPFLVAGSNLNISFFIVEHVDDYGRSHRFAANKVDSSPDATLQGFSMLISTILPEREIGDIAGVFRIGDELWSFATKSISLLDSGRLVVNTRISVKDKEKGTAELISKEPYMTIKVIGNREQTVTEFIDVGAKIEAQPTILPNGLVHANVQMSISEVLRENDRRIRGTLVPIVSFRTVNTSIDFKPGQLEMLSELTIQKTVDMESGIPFLRKIPYIGKALFTHSSRQLVNTKLYIVGGVSGRQEEQIRKYEALKKEVETEHKEKMERFGKY